MSVFTDEAQTEALVDQLVGEGKKFKTLEDLARGKVEADRTIEDRNRELQDLREELNRRLAAEELLRQNQQRNEPKVTPETETPPAGEPDKDDLAQRIREELETAKAEEQTRNNVEAVADKLIQLYGDENKANEAVKAKARELGVSVQFLQTVAEKGPKAFFAVIGVQEDAQTKSQTATRSDVNTAALGHTNTGAVKPGTWKFYETLRQENPTRYFSAKTQQQLFADRTKMGDAFYD